MDDDGPFGHEITDDEDVDPLLPPLLVAVDGEPAQPVRPVRVLMPRAETARDVLPEGLTRLGYDVDVLPVYRTVTAVPAAEDLAAVSEGAVDAVTFTSASTVNNFCDAVGELSDRAPLVVSIGPVTSESARGRGLHVGVEADPHTIDGLVAALLGALAAPTGR